jgi:hypothetical protein
VSRYLIVANQTLAGQELMDEVQRRATDSSSSFYILVPNTPPGDLPIAPSYGATGESVASATESEEHRATLRATARLRTAIEQIGSQGVAADGELTDPDPIKGIERLLEREQFDEIIISTLPAGISRWLGMDLPSRVGRKFGLPVTTVTASG